MMHRNRPDWEQAEVLVFRMRRSAMTVVLDDAPPDPGQEFQDAVKQPGGRDASYPPVGPYPTINLSGFAYNYATTTTEGTPPPSADIGKIMKTQKVKRGKPPSAAREARPRSSFAEARWPSKRHPARK